MTDQITRWLATLPDFARAGLTSLPTPIHRLPRLGAALGGLDLWIKRDDMTGLPGGGNKTRKLDFLVGEALQQGADTLVTVGAIQSNHTRQTAAAAARCGMKSALLHCAWTKDTGPNYRQVGNILFSSMFGAELYLDERERPIEDQGPVAQLAEHVRSLGGKPYLIPGGASEHRLGSLGYVSCAAEISLQSKDFGAPFDYIVHCTGSSSTQAGLLAGNAILGSPTLVIGVSDDDETEIKKARVLQLANSTLELLGQPKRMSIEHISIIAATSRAYGDVDAGVIDAVRRLARTEGLLADPVYEGKALRGLFDLVEGGHFEAGARVLLMHLGGTPAIHAYSTRFPPVTFSRFEP